MTKALGEATSRTERMVPLYQGMMTTFYDHRAADVVRSESATQRQNQPHYLTNEERADPTRLAIPQYWVRESLLDSELPEWLLAFSDITSPTNERTLVLVAIPTAGVGNTLPIVLSNASPSLTHCLLACFSSFVVDFQVRQKVGGTHMNFFYLRQVPILPPSSFERACPWDLDRTLSAWIAPRVAELVATANDMIIVARQMKIEGAPFVWSPERRALLRAELDAAFFHLYGLSHEDTDYVMETFPIVKRKEEATHGEYRAKRFILEVYDEMYLALETGEPYKTRLDPPPAERQGVATLVLYGDGAWATPQGVISTNIALFSLIEVLRTIGGAQDVARVRLAAVIVRKPALALPFLDSHAKQEWIRVVGSEAKPLPDNVIPMSRFRENATDHEWGNVVNQLKASGGLVEDRASGTWAQGPQLPPSGQMWIKGRAALAVQLLAEIDLAQAEQKLNSFIEEVEYAAG